MLTCYDSDAPISSMMGRIYHLFEKHAARTMLLNAGTEKKPFQWTTRDQHSLILKLKKQGLPNTKIAASLGIHRCTVTNILQNKRKIRC